MRLFIIITIIYEAALFVFSTYDICCTTQDDAYHIVMFHSHYPYLQHFVHYLTHTATRPLFTFLIRVPYWIDSLLFYKFVSYSAFFAEIVALYLLIRKLFDYPIALLFVIIHLAFLQYTFQHNILFAYPFYFHFAIFLFVLSLLLFIEFLQNGKLIFYFLSILFYMTVLMMYEVFVVYGLLFLVIVYIYRAPWKLFIGYLAPILLLIVLHFYLQTFFDRQYSGTTLHFRSLKDFLITLILHTSSAFPLFNTIFIHKLHQLYFLDKDFYRGLSFSFNIFSLLDWRSYLKALLVFGSSYYLLQRGVQSKKGYKNAIILLLILVFLPNILLALTKKYQIWAVQYHNFHYVTTYFSVIAFNLLIVISVFYWVKSNKRRTLVTALLFGIVSLLVDYGNYYPLRALKLSSQRWHIVKALAHSKLLPKELHCIEAPSLWSHTYSDIKMGSGYWSSYFKAEGGTVSIEKNKRCPAKMVILQNPIKTTTIVRIDFANQSYLLALQKIPLPSIQWEKSDGIFMAKVKKGFVPIGFH